MADYGSTASARGIGSLFSGRVESRGGLHQTTRKRAQSVVLTRGKAAHCSFCFHQSLLTRRRELTPERNENVLDQSGTIEAERRSTDREGDRWALPYAAMAHLD